MIGHQKRDLSDVEASDKSQNCRKRSCGLGETPGCEGDCGEKDGGGEKSGYKKRQGDPL